MTEQTYLVAYDFSECSEKVLKYAVNMAQKSSAALQVVHVVDTPTFPVTLANYEDLTVELQDLAHQKMEEVRQRYSSEGFTLQTVVLNGSPGKTILKYVNDRSIDLIFLGTHGHSKLENFLFGNTAAMILRQATCPVVSLRMTASDKD